MWLPKLLHSFAHLLMNFTQANYFKSLIYCIYYELL